MRLFGPDIFPEEDREAVSALWAWFDLAGSDLATLEDAMLIRAGEKPENKVMAAAWTKVVRKAGQSGRDLKPLADRLEATSRLRTGDGPATGKDLGPFVHLLGGSFAETLALMKGFRGSWQRRAAAQFEHGIILIDYLARTPELARKGITLYCKSDMSDLGITTRALAGASPPAKFERLAWKQSVRARDFLAGARPLILDMDWGDRLYAKRVWLTALERVLALEKAGFDVWQGVPELSRVAHARVRIQSIFGKAAFQNA
ncbi:MAG: hypothetical protein ACI9W4_002825 [Rhodothermales bacterium]|jgi:hypothetical protein